MRTNIPRSGSSARQWAAMTSVRKRVLVIVAVVALSLWAIYPPAREDQARVGPERRRSPRAAGQDRRRASTGDTDHRRAAAKHVDRRASRFSSKLEATGPTEFRVEGIQDEAAFRGLSAEAGDSSIGSSGRHAHVSNQAGSREAHSRGTRFSRRSTRSSGASTNSASPSRSSRGTARTTRSSCSSPASRTSTARSRSSGRRRNCG